MSGSESDVNWTFGVAGSGKRWWAVIDCGDEGELVSGPYKTRERAIEVIDKAAEEAGSLLHCKIEMIQ